MFWNKKVYINKQSIITYPFIKKNQEILYLHFEIKRE